MATALGKRTTPRQEAPPWSLRMVEWCIAGVVVLLLLGAFGLQVRRVLSQGELAAFNATMGALRTAFVTDHLLRATGVQPKAVAFVQRNPFELLERHPPNYLGLVRRQDNMALPPGSWVFDDACVCIGYLPMDDQWFDSPSGASMMWFQVSMLPGPLQLTAWEPYVWHGRAVR